MYINLNDFHLKDKIKYKKKNNNKKKYKNKTHL